MLKIKGYGEYAKEIDCESYQCFAREEVGATIPRYYIRCQGDMPFDPKGEHEGMAGKKVDGRPFYPWLKVSEQIFNYYLQFLKTGRGAFRETIRKLIQSSN